MLTFQKYVCISCGRSSHLGAALFYFQRFAQTRAGRHSRTLTEVDSAGQFLVNWDTGKRTALNLEDDHFRIFQPEPMELKLHFPLHGDFYTRNEWGDLVDDRRIGQQQSLPLSRDIQPRPSRTSSQRSRSAG